MNAIREEIHSHFTADYAAVGPDADGTVRLDVVDCTGSGRRVRLDGTQVLLLTRALINALRAGEEISPDERCANCEVIEAVERGDNVEEAVKYAKGELDNYRRW